MKRPHKRQYVADMIRAEIESGKYASNGKMPTEAEYVELFNVSRQTVRGALEDLEEAGFIYKVQGSGTFAKPIPQKRTNTGQIAVVCTYISEYIFPSILRGIEKVATANNYLMLVNSTNNSIATERTILSKLIENPTDGIIIEGTKTALPNPNCEFYTTLSKMGIPVVFINGFYPDVSANNVVHVITDDYGGSYSATKELIERGHTNICGIFKSDDTQGVNRYKGYIDSLLHHGANVKDSNVIWFSTETKDVLVQNIESYINVVDKDCTSVVCYNDQIAEALVQYLDSREDSTITSLVSFDKAFHISSQQRDVISYSHPKEKLGTIAAEKLFGMIDGQKERSMVMPWES